MRPRHIAIVSGLTLALAVGGPQIAVHAFADGSADEDAIAAAADGASGAEALPAPADFDKADFYEEAPSIALFSARAATSHLGSVSVSAEMKYFTKYESHSNYRQGFGSGDGYNALGYYQFDRRWSLIPFLREVYAANPTRYAMLKAVIDRGNEVVSATSMYDSSTKTLTALGKLVQDAWYAAYDANPAEFSAFQDAYAYNSYYKPTESWMASSLGIDMSGRADCVKGMVWGLSNLWGTGGVQKLIRGANLTNEMTDREFVTALSAQMTDNIAKYSSQTQYYQGWQNRYRSELNDCLVYIVLDEAEQAQKPATPTTPGEGSGSTNDGVSGNGAAGDGAGNTETPVDTPSDDGSGEPGSDSPVDTPQDDPSGDASETPADDSSDGVGDDSGTTPSQPQAPSAPGVGADGTGDAPASDAGSGDDGGASESPSADGNGSNATPSVDSPSSDEGSEGPASATTDDGSGEDGTGDASLLSDGRGDGGSGDDGSDKKSSSDAESDAGDDAKKRDASAKDSRKSDSGEDAARMPQTSDLIMLAGLGSASAAAFGATFIASGKHLARRDKDQDGE